MNIHCPTCQAKLTVTKVTPNSAARCPKCGGAVPIDLPPPRLAARVTNEQPLPVAARPIEEKFGTPAVVERPSSRRMLVGGLCAVVAVGAAVAVWFTTRGPKPAAVEPAAETPAVAATLAKPIAAGDVNGTPVGDPAAKSGGPVGGNGDPKPPAQDGGKPTTPAVVPNGPMTGQEVYRSVLRSSVFIVDIDEKSGGISHGSGVVVCTEPPLVVTNYHVADGSRPVNVVFPVYDGSGQVVTEFEKYFGRGRRAPAVSGRVVRPLRTKDLAIVQLDGRLPPSARPILLAADPATPGQTIYSIGNSSVNLQGADAGYLWRLTTGTVRGRKHGKALLGDGQRFDGDVLETQAPVNHGDSGGPVANDRGELVAVVSHGEIRTSLVNGNIDLTEVRAALEQYAKKAGFVWRDAARTPLVPIKTAAEYVAQLAAPSSAARIEALNWVAGLGESGRKHIPAVLAALDPPARDVSTAVATTLESLGPPLPTDGPAVTRALDGGRPERAVVVEYLGRLGSAAKEFIPAVLGAASGAGAVPLQVVRSALEKIGPPAPSGVPAVARGLAGGGVAREYALKVFADSIAPPEDAIPALVGLFTDQDRTTRRRAVAAVSRYGAGARGAALAPLLQAVADVDTEVAGAATAAIVAFRPYADSDRTTLEQLTVASVPLLTRTTAAGELARLLAGKDADLIVRFGPMLDTGAPEMRRIAAVALSESARTRRTIKHQFATLATDSDAQVRRTCYTAAVADGRDEAVYKILTERLERETDPVALADLASSVGRMLRDDGTDADAVRALHRKGGPAGRAVALNAVAKQPHQFDAFADAVKGGLADPDLGVRAAACRVFAARRPKAADLPPLVALVPDRLGPPIPGGGPVTVDDVGRAALAAVAAAGDDGAAALVKVFDRQGGSPALRAEVCRLLAARTVPPDGMVKRVFTWVDAGNDPPESAADLVMKAVYAATDPMTVVRSLIDRADFSSPAARNAHPPLVRAWVMKAFGKLDPAKLPPDVRKRIGVEVRNTSRYDPDADVKAAAVS